MKSFFLKTGLTLLCLIIGLGSAWGEDYELVTTAPTDWSGSYLIAYVNGTSAYVYNGTDSGANNGVSTTISSNKISFASGMAVIEVASMTDGYSLKVAGGTNKDKYLSGGTKNGTTFNTNAVANSLSMNTDGTVKIKNNTSTSFQFNSASDQQRFRYFTSNQKGVKLFKKVENVTPKTYTVTFEAGPNGSCSTSSLTEASAGAGVTLPSCTANTNYTFVGWSTSSTPSSADAGTAGENYKPSSDCTLYAYYTYQAPSHTAHFSINGTINDAYDCTVTEGSAITFPTGLADINGKKFVGWGENTISGTTDNKPTIVESATMGTSDVTYYAVYATQGTGAGSGSSNLTSSEMAEHFNSGTGMAYGDDEKSWKDGDVTWSAKAYSTKDANFLQLRKNAILSYVKIQAPGAITSVSFNAKNASDNAYSGTIYLVTEPTSTSSTNAVGSVTSPLTNDNGTITPTGSNNTLYIQTSAGLRLRDIEVIYSTGASYSDYCTTVGDEPTPTKTLTSIEVSGTPAEFWKGYAFNHDGMTVMAYYDDESSREVTSLASYSGYDMNTAGEQTVTVTYQEKTATYNINIKTIANTQATAYTVAKAKELIDAGKDLSTEVYVAGTISEIVTEFSSQYGNISFNVSEDGTTTGQQFQFFRNFKGVNSTKWTSEAEAPKVGDQVVGFGKLTKYVKNDVTTYEFTEKNYIVSITRATTDLITESPITVNANQEYDVRNYLNLPYDYPEGPKGAYNISMSVENLTAEQGVCVYPFFTFRQAGEYTIHVVVNAIDGYAGGSGDLVVNVVSGMHNVTIDDEITNGSVSADKEEAGAGETVTLTATPDEHYHFVSWYVHDGNADEVTIANDQFTMPNSDVLVSATFAEDAKVAITWNDRGNTNTENVYVGSALQFPTAPVATGWTFVGWTASSSVATDGTGLELLTNDAVAPAAATTYYAVFAKQGGGGDSQTNEITYNTTNIPTGYGASADVVLNGATFNVTQMYKNGEKMQWRAAGNENGTGTLYNKTAFNNIQSVAITYDSSDSKKNFTVFVGNTENPTSGTEITAAQVGTSATYVYDCSSISPCYFVLTNGANAGYLTSIVITYGGGATYSNYTLNPTERTLESITLSGAPTKTNYNVGDTFDRTGITATAHYSDNTDADVTDEAEWTVVPETLNTAGSIDVEVMTGIGAVVSDVETYTVTVTAPEQGDYVLTPLADINETDEVIITMTNSNGTYALPNNLGTSTPTVVAVTVSGNSINTDNTNILWNIKKSGDGLTIYPNGGSGHLYCIDDNSGVRVGTGENYLFNIDKDYLHNIGQDRYIGVFNNQDFRSYTSINTNIENQTLAFYVKAKTLTSISLENQTTTFTEGDDFAFGGAVTAHYDDESTKDVTTSATFTGYDMSILGTEQTVTVSYTEGGVTKEASYNIIVNAATKYTVTIETPTNGTLVVKHGDDDVTSGAQFAVGEILDITVIPDEGYKFRNWQANDGTTHTFTTSFEWEMSANDVTLTANFDEIQDYTIAWSVNGQIVKSETLEENVTVVPVQPTDDLFTAAVPTGVTKVFTGWVTTPTVDADSEPSYVTPATTATEDVTYYAVFANKEVGSGSDSSSKEQLTSEEIVNLVDNGTLAYDTETTYKDGDIEYSIYGYQQSLTSPWIQLKKDKDSYIKITAPSAISNVTIKITSTTNSKGGADDITKHTAFSGKVGLTTSDCTFDTYSENVASATDIQDNTAVLEPTGTNTELYLKVSSGARIWDISVTYGGGTGTTYSDFTTQLFLTTITVSKYGSTTLSLDKDYTMPEGLTGKIITAKKHKENEGDGYYTLTYVTKYNAGDVVPAGEALVIQDGFTLDESRDYRVYEGTATGEVTSYPDNLLCAEYTEDANGKWLTSFNNGVDNYYYKLTTKNGANFGWYYGDPEGAPFLMSRDDRAYLVIAKQIAASIRGFALEDGEEEDLTTGIDNMETNSTNSIYNLQGLQQSKLQKGINIVNGKKVIR